MGAGSSKGANTNVSAKTSPASRTQRNDKQLANGSPATSKPSANNKNNNEKTTNNNSKLKNQNTPKKTNVSKNKNTWDSDDDMDDFINNTVKSSAAAVGSNEDQYARPRTSHGRSGRAPTNNYPESYAQKIARERKKADTGMLIRQKTIYRNPDEWDDDSDEEKENKNQKGFDASKFRKYNQQKNVDPVSDGVAQEFEAPLHLKDEDNEDFGIYQRDIKELTRRRISRLPSYNQEEQRLMDELLNSDY